MNDDLVMRTVVVLIVAAIHAVYIALVVTRESVKEAARRYARVDLVLSVLDAGTSRHRFKEKSAAVASV
jgi:hypothetical protein